VGTLDRITLGSRGSELARAQARLVEEALRVAWPKLEVVLEIVRTSGDESADSGPILDRGAGRKGMFTREIERELLVRRIDVAVHSAKDLPSERLEELEVRATLPRARTEDVLITKNGAGLTTLPSGATVATGSIRRQRQLAWQRPDLQIADLRGNVPTRLRKLHEHEDWSGIILALAGLERLGIALNGGILSPDAFLPAGGQGVVALQLRHDDEHAQQLVDAVDDRATHLCLRAEREFLRLLNGDCDSPVGVQGRIEGENLNLRAQVFEVDRVEPRAGVVTGPSDDPESVATKLMKQLYGE
jgi:hydroxymethylbilane synthase